MAEKSNDSNKVTVIMAEDSFGVKAGAQRTLPKEDAERLIAQGLATAK